MNSVSELVLKWIKLGIISGFLVSIIYPALLFIPMPFKMFLILVMAWGPLLALSGVGLYFFMSLDRKTISMQIAAASQVVAGVVVTLMFIMQYAIRFWSPSISSKTESWVWDAFMSVQLGVDVTWDVFIFLSTLLFSINMYKHPHFGKVFSIIGIIIAVLLIGTNIMTFPFPPKESGSFDMGPYLGLWGLGVTINIFIKYKQFYRKDDKKSQ